MGADRSGALDCAGDLALPRIALAVAARPRRAAWDEAVAGGRIETGDHNPSLGTLARLATGLELELLIDIRPQGRDAKLPRKRTGRSSSFETQGAEVLVASA